MCGTFDGWRTHAGPFGSLRKLLKSEAANEGMYRGVQSPIRRNGGTPVHGCVEPEIVETAHPTRKPSFQVVDLTRGKWLILSLQSVCDCR